MCLLSTMDQRRVCRRTKEAGLTKQKAKGCPFETASFFYEIER